MIAAVAPMELIDRGDGSWDLYVLRSGRWVVAARPATLAQAMSR